MLVLSTYDPDEFLAAAKRDGASSVSVTRTAEVVPRTGADQLVNMIPAVALRYCTTFRKQNGSECKLIFDEQRIADAEGLVSLDGTLWDKLQREKPVKYYLVMRSGSF